MEWFLRNLRKPLWNSVCNVYYYNESDSKKTLALSWSFAHGGRAWQGAPSRTADTHSLSDKVLTPLLKVFLEQKGQHVAFQHLWLRSGLFKPTFPSHFPTNVLSPCIQLKVTRHNFHVKLSNQEFPISGPILPSRLQGPYIRNSKIKRFS